MNDSKLITIVHDNSGAPVDRLDGNVYIDHSKYPPSAYPLRVEVLKYEPVNTYIVEYPKKGDR